MARINFIEPKNSRRYPSSIILSANFDQVLIQNLDPKCLTNPTILKVFVSGLITNEFRIRSHGILWILRLSLYQKDGLARSDKHRDIPHGAFQNLFELVKIRT